MAKKIETADKIIIALLVLSFFLFGLALIEFLAENNVWSCFFSGSILNKMTVVLVCEPLVMAVIVMAIVIGQFCQLAKN